MQTCRKCSHIFLNILIVVGLDVCVFVSVCLCVCKHVCVFLAGEERGSADECQEFEQGLCVSVCVCVRACVCVLEM